MQEGRRLTGVATSTLATKQYFIVAIDTSNDNGIVLANAQTLPIIGVLENFPGAADTATVVMPIGGTMLVKAGGTITAGAYVTADSAGKAIATTSAGDQVIGRALKAAVDGDIFEVACTGLFRY
jgi:hypothetical protein